MEASSTTVKLFILLSILTSPYRCDTNSSTVSSQQQNSFNVNSNRSSKSGSSEVFEEQQNGHQIPLVRLPSNTLLKYTAYKDVSIQHFLIPMDTRSAMFSFKSNEESKSALSECRPLIFNFLLPPNIWLLMRVLFCVFKLLLLFMDKPNEVGL